MISVTLLAINVDISVFIGVTEIIWFSHSKYGEFCFKLVISVFVGVTEIKIFLPVQSQFLSHYF